MTKMSNVFERFGHPGTYNTAKEFRKAEHKIECFDELLSNLEQMVRYAQWQIAEGESHHPTLPTAVGEAVEAINKAWSAYVEPRNPALDGPLGAFEGYGEV